MNNQGGNYGRAPAPGNNDMYPAELRTVSRYLTLFEPIKPSFVVMRYVVAGACRGAEGGDCL